MSFDQAIAAHAKRGIARYEERAHWWGITSMLFMWLDQRESGGRACMVERPADEAGPTGYFCRRGPHAGDEHEWAPWPF